MKVGRKPTLFDHGRRPSSDDPFTFAEYFAGVGLARMGLEAAGWTPVFANDLDEQKRRMYEGHFGADEFFVLEDIHRLAESPEKVPHATLAHASFPCTDLSVAGRRGGLDAGQSSAFWGFHSLLEAQGEARPQLVLLENVTGFLSSNGGQDFRSALKAMNDLGYAVDPFIIDAAHFVPQSRPRLFVVCDRGSDPTECLAPDALEPSTLRPKALLDAVTRASDDIDWCIRSLPDLPPYGSRKLGEILDQVPAEDDQWWSQERADYLYSQMSERHQAVARRMMESRKWSHGTVFRRVRNGRSMAELRTDGIAGCLRTPKGGSGRQILFQAGYGKYRVRLLNADECARLMGANNYHIAVSLNQALFGFGDAVCVPVIEWIARNYLNNLVHASACSI
ncbi:MAG: DNA cytosine methyltransferase [Planctomycetota bacterium]|nr:MAG: DNA cytosine methyltransferase [Planctomycetota bacterium]